MTNNSSTLQTKITSEINIYNAIYSLESYLFEKNLLSEEDIKLYYKLTDKYNFNKITEFIGECKSELNNILEDKNKLFNVQVYFKLKKLDNDDIEYRPIHTASLKAQVCMVAILNILMFDDDYNNNTRKLSSLSQLIPGNFFGNLPSTKPENIFQSWQYKYQEYSDKIIDKYNEYKNNKTYKYEVSLDFKNFFPSINPLHIYKYITNKLSAAYKGEDYETLKIAVYKLLYCNISYFEDNPNIELKSEYYKNAVEEQENIQSLSCSRGILQGLPQGYYFGNLCMIELAKEINKKFEGDSFYYVDDSVIYTNNYIDETKFIQDIDYLNTKFNETVEEDKTDTSEDEIIKLITQSNQKEIKYEIKLHTEGKSYISEINYAHWGFAQLRYIAGETYNINNALKMSTDEVEDATTYDKLKNIIKIIDKELNRIDEEFRKIDKELDIINTELKKIDEELKKKNETLERKKKLQSKRESITNYQKLLLRYKKFCLFRKRIIFERTEEQEEEKYPVQTFTNKYLKNNPEDFFQIYENDIFAAELGITTRNCDQDELSILIGNVKKFETKITKKSNCADLLYYSKDVEGQKWHIIYALEKQSSLNIWVKKNFKNNNKIDTKNTIDQLQKARLKLQETIDLLQESKDKLQEETNKGKPFSIFSNSKYTSFISKISTEFRRQILNAIYSRIINVEFSESMNIQKCDYRPLKYFELRLLVYLRNKKYDTNSFKLFATNLLLEAKNDSHTDNIDYHILEILPVFISKVQDPNNIDSLILVHKLVNGLWKNGSQFLHFYTLHNEEHSIELIKKTIKIINTISYFRIKTIDYYILFLACYLHDISMIISPDLNRFCADSIDSDKIYTNWLQSLFTIINDNKKHSKNDNIKSLAYIPKHDLKKHILNYFQQVYSYFENDVRSKHTEDSASFIKRTNNSYLEFIDSTILQIVAEISESHGYDTPEVYGRKSQAKSELFSIKYMMILIRLADLLDLAKDRISFYILKENIKHMSPISQFHWISHYITDSCKLKASYTTKEIDKNETFIQKGAIIETIKLELNINIQQLTNSDGSNCICKKYFTCKHDINNKKFIYSILDTDNSPHNSCDSCTMLCKWMTQKHEYLFKELHALYQYLTTVNEGLVKNKIIVEINYKNNKTLDASMMDSIVNYLKE